MSKKYPLLNDKAWLYQKYWVEELSIPKIAKIVGCSQTAVYKAFNRLNIPLRDGSEAHKGKLHPLYGKHRTEETKQKIRKGHIGKPPGNKGKRGYYRATEATKQKMSEANRGKHYMPKESRESLSAMRMGENNPNWCGGTSFEPYCPAFNEKFKEYIRDKFGRVCFLCPRTEKENGRKLSVHHVNYNKNCFCEDDIDCQFVPLCSKCHSKTNHNREYWEREITTKLHEKINGWYI